MGAGCLVVVVMFDYFYLFIFGCGVCVWLAFDF